MSEQKPSVGRIVHYQSYGTPKGEFKSLPRAAVISAVHENGTVDVVVFNPEGLFFNKGLSMGGPDGTVPTPGCWNWPPRV